MNESQDEPVRLNIRLDDDVAQGVYSNLVMISHGESEFVLDFMFVQPGRPEAKVGSRVILAPAQAERLMGVLGENLRRHRARFGSSGAQADDALVE